jgi:hypothetical protein
MLHPRRVESSSPAPLIVLGQLEIVALPVHPHRDVTYAGRRVEPGPEHLQCPVIREGVEQMANPRAAPRRWARESGTLLDHLVRPQK